MFLYQPDAFPGLFAITRIGSDTQKIEALFGGKGDIRFGGVLDAHEHAEFSLAEERRGEIKGTRRPSAARSCRRLHMRPCRWHCRIR